MAETLRFILKNLSMRKPMENQKSEKGDKTRKNWRPDTEVHWGQLTVFKTAVDNWQPKPGLTQRKTAKRIWPKRKRKIKFKRPIHNYWTSNWRTKKATSKRRNCRKSLSWSNTSILILCIVIFILCYQDMLLPVHILLLLCANVAYVVKNRKRHSCTWPSEKMDFKVNRTDIQI